MSLTPAVDSDKGQFCASCGGADVVTSELAGTATCNVCGWSGRLEELATFYFQHDLGSTDAVFRAFFLDIRNFLSTPETAQRLGAMLIKWGFIDQPTTDNAAMVGRRLGRYVAVIGKSVAEGLVQARRELEKEDHATRRA